MRACLINDFFLDNIPAKMEQLGLSQEGGAALSTSKSLTSFGEETFGSDSDMNRQDIASGGVAPIVARESVFKYHMSKKEKEVRNTQHFNEIFFAPVKIKNSVKFKNRQDIGSGSYCCQGVCFQISHVKKRKRGMSDFRLILEYRSQLYDI